MINISEIKKGLKVWYFPIIKTNGDKVGGRKTTIRSDEVWEVGGETVCFIEGVSEGVSIKHIEPINAEVESD